MSRDMSLLQPGFHAKVDELLDACAKRYTIMRPYFTLRSPWEQARIWRSTRATEQVNKASTMLAQARAPFLAEVLKSVGPQYAQPGQRGHLTNALPGQSWHQYGLAVDCFWLYDGETQWDVRRQAYTAGTSFNGYKVYGEIARNLGLTSMGLQYGWDWPHVQEPRHSSPLKEKTWSEIDEEMLNKFGLQEAS